MQAILSNAQHPEYGEVTIPFPIGENEYGRCLELLGKMEIGNPIERDCFIREIQHAPSILQQLVGCNVTVDELDYLTKRLDSFDDREMAKFQGAAVSCGCHGIVDFINLTFSCQQVTIITDFSDLESIGRNHYMTLNGGSARMEELDNLDGTETALLLIESGDGVITPYGVVYDNCMRLSQDYDGRHLPEYYYTRCTVSVMLSADGRPEQQEMLYFPCAESKISRAVRRLGVDRPEQCTATLKLAEVSDAVRGIFGHECPLNEHLDTLNALTRYLQAFDEQALEKFHTVFDIVWPQTPEEVLSLAENLHEFTVVPDISTAEEYGRYIIRESGHFEVDPSLEDYIDYQSYGERRVQEEGGLFGDRGYVAYLGTKPEMNLLALGTNSAATSARTTLRFRTPISRS